MIKIRKEKLTNYSYIHQWNNENHPKTDICENCTKLHCKTEWSLIHGKEHTRGIENYRELCQKCHRKYDFIGRTIWNKGNVTTYPKKCEYCLVKFNGKKKSSRFCSNVCSGKWRYKEGNNFKIKLNKKS